MIRRYKQSVMQSCTHDEAANKIASNPLITLYCDNVDHNIRILDGLNTFHGMGIISATVLPSGDFSNRCRVVPRLDKLILAGEAPKDKCAPTHVFTKGNGKGISSVVLQSMLSLSLQSPIILPAVMDLSSL